MKDRERREEGGRKKPKEHNDDQRFTRTVIHNVFVGIKKKNEPGMRAKMRERERATKKEDLCVCVCNEQYRKKRRRMKNLHTLHIHE